MGWLSWQDRRGPTKTPGGLEGAGVWYVLCRWTGCHGIVRTMCTGVISGLSGDFRSGLFAREFCNEPASRMGVTESSKPGVEPLGA